MIGREKIGHYLFIHVLSCRQISPRGSPHGTLGAPLGEPSKHRPLPIATTTMYGAFI